MSSPVLNPDKTTSWVKVDEFLFILSAPRSGSTLLRVMLNKIPNIISPPETYFLEFYRDNKKLDLLKRSDREILVQNWVAFRNHLNVRNLYNRKDFERLVVEEAGSWKDVFSILIQLYAKDAGKEVPSKPIICEKTPVHIELQEELLEVFPNTRIIYLIRDPRDVVASLKTCPWASSDVRRNSFYWSKTANLIENRKNSILIKYEDLVETPEREFQKIGYLLDIDIDYKILHAEAPNEDKESLDPKNLASYKPIDNSYKNKWKTRLSQPDHELEVIENICYREMKRFGYSLISQPNAKLLKFLSFQRWVDKQYGRIYRRIT